MPKNKKAAPEDKKAVIKKLTALLEECGIENFTLDASEKRLLIRYKEDFDVFYPKLNAQPQKIGEYRGMGDLPYGATHWAFFNYEGWDIRGNIIHHKPEGE